MGGLPSSHDADMIISLVLVASNNSLTNSSMTCKIIIIFSMEREEGTTELTLQDLYAWVTARDMETVSWSVYKKRGDKMIIKVFQDPFKLSNVLVHTIWTDGTDAIESIFTPISYVNETFHDFAAKIHGIYAINATFFIDTKSHTVVFYDSILIKDSKGPLLCSHTVESFLRKDANRMHVACLDHFLEQSKTAPMVIPKRVSCFGFYPDSNLIVFDD